MIFQKIFNERSSMAKEYANPMMGKIKPHRNGKLNLKSKNYDPYIAARRKKEKARRKANRQNRGR